MTKPAIDPQAPLRGLHPQVERGGAGAGVQLARTPSARPARRTSRASASEGWALIRDRYDDGGFSGGTLERPALKRLLADIEAGRVDVVVVYKIDRLSRSLMDFSKLVEVFDRSRRLLRLGHPVVQHHDVDGAAHA